MVFSSLFYAKEKNGVKYNSYYETNTLLNISLYKDTILYEDTVFSLYKDTSFFLEKITDTNYLYNEIDVVNNVDTINNVEVKNNLKGSSFYNINAAFKIGDITDKYEILADYWTPMFEIFNGTYYSLSLSLGIEYYYTNSFSVEYAIGIYNSKVISNFDIYLPMLNGNEVKEVKTAHEIDLNLLDYGVAFLAKYLLINNFQLMAGCRFGASFRASYDHHVKILSDEIVYSDGSKERSFLNKQIVNTQGHIAATFGALYKMKFKDSKCGLSFSLTYERGFNTFGENVISTTLPTPKIQFYSLNVGIAFTYGP
jgi:hypothetical protein